MAEKENGSGLAVFFLLIVCPLIFWYFNCKVFGPITGTLLFWGFVLVLGLETLAEHFPVVEQIVMSMQ